MLGHFNKIFGIEASLTTEQHSFVQRINQTVIHEIEQMRYPTAYKHIFTMVCYKLGINANDRIGQANRNNYFDSDTIIPSLRSLTNDDFVQTLKVLVLLYGCFGVLQNARAQKELSNSIEVAIANATIDIGVKWRDGMFYPSGARELDEKLIEEPLKWLTRFPTERVDYLKALRGYIEKRPDDVIINCYLVVEGIARSVLSNKKTLDNNREELMKMIGLSQEWKGLLNNFIIYANEFKRHASEKRHNLNPVEVEGFLYLTGILVRMIVESQHPTAR